MTEAPVLGESSRGQRERGGATPKAGASLRGPGDGSGVAISSHLFLAGCTVWARLTQSLRLHGSDEFWESCRVYMALLVFGFLH